MTRSPNILVITTDQQRTDTLSCYGSNFTSTPAFDRLALEGVLYERAYCANSVCSPSRVSLFSGLFPSRHGVWNVGMKTPSDTELLSHWLNRHGYQTHYIGKCHFQPYGHLDSVESRDQKPDFYASWHGPYYGFETVELANGHTTYGLNGHYGAWVRAHTSPDEYAAYTRATARSMMRFGGEAHDWTLPTALHQSVWTAERTLAFLDQHDDTQPFFLAVGFQDPHHPHALPQDFRDRVSPDAVPLPAFTPGELDDKPPHYLAAHQGRLEESPWRGEFYVAGQGAGADFTRVTETDAREGRAYYYSMVRLIDQQLGRILDGLEARGLLDHTIVLVTSDHGELLGDHGLWMKGPFHYEPLVRVPLLIRYPAAFAPGQRITGLAHLTDIVPTLLGLLDLRPDERLDGQDLLAANRESAIVEFTDDPGGLRLKTVITANLKLTAYHGQSFGELYDLEADPGEVINRWHDPAYRGHRAELLHLLLDHMEVLERRCTRISYA